MMAHLLCRYALNDVTRLQWIHYHSVDFLLATVHLHFSLIGEQLPIVFTLTDPLAGKEELLATDIIDLRPQPMVTGKGASTEYRIGIFAFILIGGGTGVVLTSCAYVWLETKIMYISYNINLSCFKINNLLRLQSKANAQFLILLDFVQTRFDGIEELIFGQCWMRSFLQKISKRKIVCFNLRGALLFQTRSKRWI